VKKSVVVIGGGLAGIRAALSCRDAGLEVTLLEGRPRLGGATWSSRRGSLEIDNGVHVFLRCCDRYQELLARLGASDKVKLQERLSLQVVDPTRGRACELRRIALPSPLHLLPGLAGFVHLPLRGRLRAAFTAQKLSRLDLRDPALDDIALGDWLRAQGESAHAIDSFWELLVRPTVNVSAADASLLLAAKVFQTGLFEAAGNADIGWSRVSLQELHGESAMRALEKSGVRVLLRARVDELDVAGRARARVRVVGETLRADAAILATDHEGAAALLPHESGLQAEKLRGLGRSPIVNLHVFFDRRVTNHELVAGIHSPVEWVFDRSEAAGYQDGQYLAVSLSAADRWVGRSRAELESVFRPALAGLFPKVSAARIVDFLVTSEPAATFLQRPGTLRYRPPNRTESSRLWLAGSWTDTGWPATMEGAVRSGLAAAHGVLDALAH